MQKVNPYFCDYCSWQILPPALSSCCSGRWTQPDTASVKVMEGASLEKAEDKKQNGLEDNLGEVMRGSETRTELGTGLAGPSPCA